MDHRELQLLLSQPMSLEGFDQLYQIVQQAPEATKKDLATEAIYASLLGRTVTSPVNGFILYILCLGHQDVSIQLLREHWNKIEYAVFENWTMSLSRIGRQDDSFDPAIRDLALFTYSKFIEWTMKWR
jgi:hypothetical protein